LAFLNSSLKTESLDWLTCRRSSPDCSKLVVKVVKVINEPYIVDAYRLLDLYA
jgi:hypothetical protein